MSAITPSLLQGETLLQFLARFVAALRDREDQLGQYSGDGLTATQADELLDKLRPVYEGSGTASASVVWNAFRASVEAETSWVFPERDYIGQQIIWAMRIVQKSLGPTLEGTGIMTREAIEKYVSLAMVVPLARRQEVLHGNRIMWRLMLARFLHWLGGGSRS